MTINLVLVDDDPIIRELVPQIMKPHDIIINALEDPRMIRDIPKQELYDGLITDGHLNEGKTYLDSITEWHQARRYSPILVCSGDPDLLVEARELGHLGVRKGIYIESYVTILREYFR